MNISEGLVIKLPMRPYLWKFLTVEENLEPDQPLDITSTSLVATTLALLLCKKTEFLDSTADPVSDRFSEDLAVWINPTRVRTNEMFFTPDAVRTFDHYMHRLFQFMLCPYIYRRVSGGMQEREAIREFLAYYDITEDDMSLTSVKRAATKLRTARGLRPFHVRKTNPYYEESEA